MNLVTITGVIKIQCFSKVSGRSAADSRGRRSEPQPFAKILIESSQFAFEKGLSERHEVSEIAAALRKNQ